MSRFQKFFQLYFLAGVILTGTLILVSTLVTWVRTGWDWSGFVSAILAYMGIALLVALLAFLDEEYWYPARARRALGRSPFREFEAKGFRNHGYVLKGRQDGYPITLFWNNEGLRNTQRNGIAIFVGCTIPDLTPERAMELAREELLAFDDGIYGMVEYFWKRPTEATVRERLETMLQVARACHWPAGEDGTPRQGAPEHLYRGVRGPGRQLVEGIPIPLSTIVRVAERHRLGPDSPTSSS